MYRILIRTEYGNHLFYKTDGIVFQTTSLDEAKLEFELLIKNHGKNFIKIVKMVDTEVDIVTDADVVWKYTDISTVNIVNDGNVFHLDAEYTEPGSCAISYDEVLFETMKSYLEDLGLTDVKLDVWGGLNATNPTGTPVIGVYEIPEGFFTIANSITNTVDWKNNNYILQIGV